jgi:hypothetical protein
MARGEAILAGSPDPAHPVDAPKPTMSLRVCKEERVRSAITAVLDVDRNFETLSPDSVSDEQIRSACQSFLDAVNNA